MKTILFGVIISLLISVSVHSQGFWEWGDPFPLTDSLSDNANPYLFLEHDNGEKLFMVWEKHIDFLTSSIFMDNILDADPAQEILYAPEVRYTNPKIMEIDYYSSCDSLFLLLFETNENGNIDIYSKAYMADGSFLPAQPLINTESDELQFIVGSDDFIWDGNAYFRNTVMYLRNDSLFAKNLMVGEGNIFFDEDTLVDTAFCRNPTLSSFGGDRSVYYLKADTGNFYIYRSSGNNNGIWETPEIFYDSADCRNLDHSLHFGNLVWSAYKDTSWKIMIFEWPNDFNTYGLSKATPFNAAALEFIYGVKNWGDLWIATPYPENDTNEIFMTIGPGAPDFENFSNGGGDNRNPQFYTGESANNYYCWYDYLVWESYRNGYWQIWGAKMIQCMGSVNENENNDAIFTTHPNPFTHNTTLEFTLDNRSEVLIEVYDNRGMHISTIANKTFDQGKHQLRWDGGGLAAGIYIIKMTVGDMIYTSKVIKSP